MSVHIRLRPPREEDAADLGLICYEAFRTISSRHNFPPDFPAPEAAQGLLAMAIAHPQIWGVVAERAGRPIGSNFLWEQSDIAGVGPVTVDPGAQDSGVGRRLMDAVLKRAEETSRKGVRLVQAAFHGRSLSLYAGLGFEVKEPLANMNGPAIGKRYPGYDVRPATGADAEACNALCRAVHGHDRAGEVRDAVTQGGATVVERGGRITGYATGVGFFGHVVGQTNADVQALIAAAPEISGPGLLLPTRNAQLFRWALGEGLRVVQPMTLMSRGFYQEPKGAFLPSILF
jgi:GNAT superfamily N-acetyltransferase